MNPKKQPTLKSVAKKVGVTANTVSLALRDSPLVIEETKALIKKAAKEMGYIPNVLAGSLRSGRSNTIAILVGDISNFLFSQRIKALERTLGQAGYQVLIINTDEQMNMEIQAIRTAVSHQVDGIIICPCQHDKKSMELLKSYQIPFVLLGREFFDEQIDTVVWDDYQGACLMTEHLINVGCKSIVFLNGPQHISSATLRQKGYEETMKNKGLAAHIITAAPTSGGVTQALNHLWEKAVSYDGLFVFSDLMALEASSWHMKKGLHIPKDVAIAGFDDILSSIDLPFGLTSIACDRQKEAEQTVELLLRRIGDKTITAQTIRLPVYLKVRESTEGYKKS